MTIIDPSKIDVILPKNTGYPPEKQGEDTRDQMMMAAEEAGITIVEFPKHLWIEPKDWEAAAVEAIKYRTRPIDFLDRYTHQGRSGGIGEDTHECTCHSLRAGFECAWNRQRRIAVGPPVVNKRLEMSPLTASCWMSCLSIYAEANPQKRGGASVRQVLQIAGKRGFLPDKIQPKEYNFKHTLVGTCGAGGVNQSRGDWIPVSRFPEGWEITAANFKPTECVFPEIWEQIVCLQLHGYGVHVGREGHAVMLCEYMADNDVSAYIDSYDRILFDSVSRMKRSISGACSIVTTTVPDDWNAPAGIAA